MVTERKVEAYLGEYASGKSEVALNRALDLAKQGEKVTLVDMDLVEPCYCVRGVKSMLASRGVDVVGLATDESDSIDDTGETYSEEAKNVLERDGNIIFDVGYGARGVNLLMNHIRYVESDPALKLIMVLNTKRQITKDVDAIVDYINRFWRVDAILSNTHMESETTTEIMLDGLAITKEAAERLNIPVIGIGASQRLFEHDQAFINKVGELPIHWLRDWMPKSI